MKIKSLFVAALAWAVVSPFASSSAVGQTLFSDQMTSGAGWGVNASSADVQSTFGYDYSADGIPEAPNSSVGDTGTTGVKLEANLDDVNSGEFQSLYPLGQNFTGDYYLSFDAWMNYDAVERNEGGSAGTTEFLGGGIGYDDVAADLGPGAQAISTGDGGSGSDWRVFDPSFLDPIEMVAGDRNGFNAYYSDFLPGVEPPAAQGQVGVSPPQLGTAGSPSFQWITWHIGTEGGEVFVSIEKPNGDVLPIANWNAADRGTTTDGNIMLFYSDFFSSTSARPDLTFGVIDNVRVTVPEPTTMALLGLGCVAIGLAGRRR